MQIMFQNGFSPIKNTSMGDYTIQKKKQNPLEKSSKLENKDYPVKMPKDSVSINDKRALPQKLYDPFGDSEVEQNSHQNKKPLKKIKPSSDSFLSSTFPIEDKIVSNESSLLKKLTQAQNLNREVETERRAPENLDHGIPKQKINEAYNRPKKPSYPLPNANQFANRENGMIDNGNFILNKLKFLPHVQLKDSKYGNSVVPVLPSFLNEN